MPKPESLSPVSLEGDMGEMKSLDLRLLGIEEDLHEVLARMDSLLRIMTSVMTPDKPEEEEWPPKGCDCAVLRG